MARRVSDNTIVGVVRCLGNEPAPGDVGVANSVVGVTLGQCRGL